MACLPDLLKSTFHLSDVVESDLSRLRLIEPAGGKPVPAVLRGITIGHPTQFSIGGGQRYRVDAHHLNSQALAIVNRGQGLVAGALKG